jgi:hypothetical protein
MAILPFGWSGSAAKQMPAASRIAVQRGSARRLAARSSRATASETDAATTVSRHPPEGSSLLRVKARSVNSSFGCARR